MAEKTRKTNSLEILQLSGLGVALIVAIAATNGNRDLQAIVAVSLATLLIFLITLGGLFFHRSYQRSKQALQPEITSREFDTRRISREDLMTKFCCIDPEPAERKDSSATVSTVNAAPSSEMQDDLADLNNIR